MDEERNGGKKKKKTGHAFIENESTMSCDRCDVAPPTCPFTLMTCSPY